MIYDECIELDKIIEHIRKGKGETENVIQALLRLRSKEFSYQQYLKETMEDNHEQYEINR